MGEGVRKTPDVQILELNTTVRACVIWICEVHMNRQLSTLFGHSF